jgi:hypothetical protein
MAHQLAGLAVIHRGAQQAPFIEWESARLDHIDGHAKTGRNSDNGPHILGDIGLVQS